MPYKYQPFDVAYQPPMYRHLDYEQDAEVTPLKDGGFILWQDPDRMEVYKNREAELTARELAAAAKVSAEAARDLLKLVYAGDGETYTVAGPTCQGELRPVLQSKSPRCCRARIHEVAPHVHFTFEHRARR